jgi:pSer/pThr/pTyr-binding forkhead associated (FHA) protein
MGGPMAPPAIATLICTNGHFNGVRFPINNNLAIGRNPKLCQIVFPDDTQGISSLHCEITILATGIFLTDKGSTYGTFLLDGRKLAAHESVPLAPGAGFYLADRKNEFKLL